MSEHALFVVAPYLAAACFLMGALGGLLNPSRRFSGGPVPTARIGFSGHWTLGVGLLGVAAGHTLIVVWPAQVVIWSQTLSRLLPLEVAFVAAGLAALAGVGMALGRRLSRRPSRAIGVVDAAGVGVLLVAIVSGLGLAVLYRWAAAWSAVTLAPYVQSVARFQPELRYLESMPYLVKLHLFSSGVVIALIPFTTPGRVLLRSARAAIDRALLPVAAAAGATTRLLQDRARQSQWYMRWSGEDEYE